MNNSVTCGKLGLPTARRNWCLTITYLINVSVWWFLGCSRSSLANLMRDFSGIQFGHIWRSLPFVSFMNKSIALCVTQYCSKHFSHASYPSPPIKVVFTQASIVSGSNVNGALSMLREYSRVLSNPLPARLCNF